jgi:hypothetical protein
MGSTTWEKEKKKGIAEESAKTRKAREKLKKQLDALERKVTPQALQRKTIEIHRWIERHASSRVALKNKSIALFDENQNAAKISHRIALLAQQMKKEASSTATPSESFWDAKEGGKRIVPQ